MKKSLYIILPIAFFGIIYLMGSFQEAEFNIKYWEVGTRIGTTIVGVLFMAFGVLTAGGINKHLE